LPERRNRCWGVPLTVMVGWMPLNQRRGDPARKGASRLRAVEVLKRRAPLLLVLLAPTASADTLGRVDEFVRAEMAREKVPGVAVAVVDHGKVLKAEG